MVGFFVGTFVGFFVGVFVAPVIVGACEGALVLAIVGVAVVPEDTTEWMGRDNGSSVTALLPYQWMMEYAGSLTYVHNSLKGSHESDTKNCSIHR